MEQHCALTNLLRNVISHAGDSGILLVGSTAMMNGSRPSFPVNTTIANNLVHDNGGFGKQTASYFKSIASSTNLSANVFFNSPRSLVNYNDAFRGGDLMADNLMWGAVRETADHAAFNSW